MINASKQRFVKADKDLKISTKIFCWVENHVHY